MTFIEANANYSVVTAAAVGKAHRRCGRGSQDAFAVVQRDGVVAACVADGCSGGLRSEVGAGVGARFVAADAFRRVKAGVGLDDLPRVVVADLVEELRKLACAFDAGDMARVIEEHLLFTIQCAVVVGGRAVVFGVGDGVVGVDGRMTTIDDGAAPDYSAYALFSDMRPPRVRVHHAHDSADSAAPATIVVATDGASELTFVDELVREERYVANPSLAQKRFNVWVDQQGGPVDDCTIAIVRRVGGTA